MADPLTAGVIGIGSSLAGGVFGASGAASQAASSSAMYNYQAGIAQQNAQIAQQNAQYSRQTGENQASQSGMKSRYQMGQIVANQAASGLNINSGTALDVRAGQQKIADQDQTVIRSNAAKQAYDYTVQAAQDTSQASAYSAAASNAQSAGTINVASSILGSAGSVSSKWLQGNQSGVFSGSSLSNFGNSISSIF